MPNPAHRLLKYSFQPAELLFLNEHQEFSRKRDKVETVAEFEELCIFGFNILERERILVPLRSFQEPEHLPTANPSG